MKILARGTNWIGDAVMTIPALRAIRRIFPDAQITLYTRSWAQGIFQDAEFLDEILPFDRNNSLISQTRMLRALKFDLAIIFANSFNAALTAKLAGIPVRYGYATERRGFLLSEAIAIPEWKNSRHEVYYYLNLVGEVERKLFGDSRMENAETIPRLSVSDERKESARHTLARDGVDTSKPIVILCPGSTNSRAKRWSFERYAELNDRIRSETDSTVIVVGSPEEIAVAEQVCEASRLKPHNLAGKTSVEELISLLSISSICVSNDTGTAHISAASGTGTLVIFGPTNPVTTQPIGSELIRHEVACSPCMLRDCPIDHPCMTQITVDEVFQKVLALIRRVSIANV